MKSANIAIIAFMFLLLSGCASRQAPAPDWLTGESEQYKSAQYLIGRGDGMDQESAKDRARSDIAKIFEVTVSVEGEDIQQYRTDASGTVEFENRIARNLTTRTSQIIQGIQIAELWQDPADRNFHALAILPRLQTAASLRQQIGQLDEAVGIHIEQSKESRDLFMKIAAANQAVEKQQERKSLQKMLQVVDITGRGVASSRNGEKLGSDLEALLKRVRIAPQVTEDSVPGLATVVSGALAKAGFLIETGKKPDFVLHAQMKLEDLGLKDGWYWQRGVLEITLTESATGRVRGTKRWSIKGNAADWGSATKRALDRADSVLKQELRTAIIDMATSH